MSFITNLFGGTNNSIVTIGLALGVVLILIVLGVWALKLLFNATGNVRRGRNKRLMVIDSAVVDQKRQLILIRRDNVEHLVMTGGGQDLLIETGIEPPAEQAQPVRAKRRPTIPSLKPANRAQKAAKRAEKTVLPEVEHSEPQARSIPQRQTAAPKPPLPSTVENQDPFTNDPTPEPIVAERDARGKSGQNALEKLSKLTRPTGDKKSTSLRHTGLLRSVNRVEPPINPQPSDNVTQISEAEVTDSGKSQAQPVQREQGTDISDDNEGNNGAISGKSDGNHSSAGTAS